jgi:YD repeat-containing protein
MSIGTRHATAAMALLLALAPGAARAAPTLTPVAGNGVAGSAGDGGPAVSASLSHPGGIALDSHGNLFIADTNNNRVRKVTPDGVITTFAGTGVEGFSGDGGPAMSAQLTFPADVAVDHKGDVLIAGGGRIRKVTPAGTISTIAGNGVLAGNAPDLTPAVSAPFGYIPAVLVDPADDPLIIDGVYGTIREVNASGLLVTLTHLEGPRSLAYDGHGNLVIATYNQVVAITPTAQLVTLAGTGDYGFGGDGGPATAATLAEPEDAEVDPQGNLWIADTSNNALRKVTPDGVISTVLDDSSQPRYVSRIAIDPKGAVYLSYFGANRVMRFGVPTVTAAQALSLPSNHTCTSRRAFAIHIRRLAGVTYTRATVTLRGHRVPVYVYEAKRRLKLTRIGATHLNVNRFRAFIDLRGRVRGTYKVKLTVTTATGQQLSATRTYHTCSRTGRLTGSLPRL